MRFSSLNHAGLSLDPSRVLLQESSGSGYLAEDFVIRNH